MNVFEVGALAVYGAGLIVLGIDYAWRKHQQRKRQRKAAETAARDAARVAQAWREEGPTND